MVSLGPYLEILRNNLWCGGLVTKSCPTFCHPMNGSLPGSSVQGIFQAILWRGLLLPSPGDLPDPNQRLNSGLLHFRWSPERFFFQWERKRRKRRKILLQVSYISASQHTSSLQQQAGVSISLLAITLGPLSATKTTYTLIFHIFKWLIDLLMWLTYTLPCILMYFFKETCFQ